VASIIKKIRQLKNKLTKVLSNLEKTIKDKTRGQLEKDRNKIREAIAIKVKEINLSNQQIDKLILVIKISADYIQEKQKIIDRIQNDLGFPIFQIKKITDNWKKQNSIT